MPYPFERLDREVLVDNRWHRYCRDRYVHKDGSEGHYYYVDIAGSAAVIPLFEDGSTALIHVYRYLLGCRLWEFPIGGIHDGEDALGTARRELREEAGLDARRFTSIGTFAPYKGASNEVCHYFVAEDLTWVGQQLEPSEDIEVRQMPMAEARRRLIEAELGDGQSLGGLLLLDRWRARPGS